MESLYSYIYIATYIGTTLSYLVLIIQPVHSGERQEEESSRAPNRYAEGKKGKDKKGKKWIKKKGDMTTGNPHPHQKRSEKEMKMPLLKVLKVAFFPFLASFVPQHPGQLHPRSLNDPIDRVLGISHKSAWSDIRSPRHSGWLILASSNLSLVLF